MTTSKFLNSVLNILPAIQGKQLSNIMAELKVTGGVKNITEYQAKLKELSALVNSPVPKPSFTPIRALTSFIATSDAHNIMMTSIKNDIEALFAQVNEIGEKINEHHFLMMKSLIAGLENSLADHENNIRKLEWLANTNNEFSKAIVNTFSSAELLKVSRNEVGAEKFYFDNRTYKSETAENIPSAVIDEHSNKLMLYSSSGDNIYPLQATLKNDENSYGTEIFTSVSENINNIIDGTRGTFWYRDVYLYQIVPKVSTIINFDLGSAQDINSVTIEGACNVPFYIDYIYGIAPDGSKITLLDSSTEINGRTKINFSRSFVKSIDIYFSILSYTSENFYKDKDSDIFGAIYSKNKTRLERSNELSHLARRVINSPKIIRDIGVPTDSKGYIKAYLYSFGLDNVWFQNNKYNDSGIFVSKPLSMKNAGIIAVKSNEVIGDTSPENTIEYEIIKIDNYPKYKETRFPIPKFDQSTNIINITERLILTSKNSSASMNDVGQLRFCPYVDNDNITIYKNGEVYTNWEYAISINPATKELDFTHDLSLAEDFTNFTLSPQKMYIYIKDIENRGIESAIYTVEYRIRTSAINSDDNSTVWLDKDKTVFLSDNGRVVFKKDDPDIIKESDIYLQITLRRNTSILSISPELNEYALLGAEY